MRCLAKQLKNAMETRGVTREELIKNTSLSEFVVDKMLNASRVVTKPNAQKVADYLKYKITYLFDNRKHEPKKIKKKKSSNNSFSDMSRDTYGADLAFRYRGYR